MPQPNKIPLAFAASGDKNAIPENTETTGLASWREGFPAITSAPFSEGGVAPKRADFNGIFNALSAATVWQQQGGFYAYDATTDYEVGNVVEYSGDLYKCITANGPSSAVKAPTDTTVWSKVITAADAAALYFPLAGGTLTGNITMGGNSPVISGTESQYLRLNNGSYGDGASLAIYGKSHSTYPGQFWLTALDGNSNAQLMGDPNGALTWKGNDVEVVSAKNLGAVGYVYYKSGLQICWGFNTAPTTGGTGNAVTYPRAFKTPPTTLVTRRSGASTTGLVDLPWVREPTATGMNVYVPTYTGYYWLAIGEGA